MGGFVPLCDHVPVSGRIRIVTLLFLAAPLVLTVWILLLAGSSGLWGVGNLAWGLQRQSAASISRGLSANSLAFGAAGRLASVWGVVLPGAGRLTDIGAELTNAGRVAGLAAPVAPQVLGFERPARYMVSALNDAELFGSGGAPLDLAIVEVDRARARVVESGSVGQFNPENAPYGWPVTGSEPWYRAGKKYPFANANFHPEFPISGQNLVTAWSALGQPHVDGVVTVDVAAVAAVLRVIGPLHTEGYGEVTGESVIRKVLVDAYRELPVEVAGAMAQRQRDNSELRSALITQMEDPFTAVRALAALWSTIPARHVQAYVLDPAGQKVVVAAGAQASLATAPGDILGVFIQSGVSKLAIFQKRTIVSEVSVHEDGSASVRQRVTFANEVPEGLAGDADAHEGYLALTFRQRAAFRIPATSIDANIIVDGSRALVGEDRTGPFPDDVGAAVLWQGQDIPPRESSTTTVRYTLPAGTFGRGGQLTYHLTANPQAMVVPATLQLTVRFDSGAPQPADGWQVSDQGATWQGTLDQTLFLGIAGPR